MRLLNFTAPAMSRGLVPSELMIDREEKVMLAGVPSLPLKNSKRGSSSKSKSHQGCARLKLLENELIVIRRLKIKGLWG